MPLQFKCPSCNSPLRLANTALAGKRIKCPKCAEVITVPAAEEPDDEAAEAAAPQPAKGVTARKPVKRPADDDEDSPPAPRRRGGEADEADEGDDDDAPVRKRRKPAAASQGNKTLMWVLLGVGGVLVVCGGCVTVVIIWVNQVASTANDTLTELQKNLKKELEKQPKLDQQVVGNAEWAKDKVFDVPEGASGLIVATRLGKDDEPDKNIKEVYRKVFKVRMQANKVYTIRLNAQPKSEIDPMLILEDPQGKFLTSNDDDGTDKQKFTLNSRIDFPCLQDGEYRVIATHLPNGKFGGITLLITKTNK